MVAVADTSPLNYLILIGQVDLLHASFNRVIVPDAVAAELRHVETPLEVRRWMDSPPAWLEIQSVPRTEDPMLMRLDPGEREAIQLALALGIPLVLMDETKGRRQARRMGLGVRGTLGILERAAKLGSIDLAVTLRELEATSFRIAPGLRDAALQRSLRP